MSCVSYEPGPGTSVDLRAGKRGSLVSSTFRRFCPFIGTMDDFIEYEPGPIVALVSLRGGSKRLLTPAPRLATPFAWSQRTLVSYAPAVVGNANSELAVHYESRLIKFDLSPRLNK